MDTHAPHHTTTAGGELEQLHAQVDALQSKVDSLEAGAKDTWRNRTADKLNAMQQESPKKLQHYAEGLGLLVGAKVGLAKAATVVSTLIPAKMAGNGTLTAGMESIGNPIDFSKKIAKNIVNASLDGLKNPRTSEYSKIMYGSVGLVAVCTGVGWLAGHRIKELGNTPGDLILHPVDSAKKMIFGNKENGSQETPSVGVATTEKPQPKIDTKTIMVAQPMHAPMLLAHR
jgi:hypothetical protein